MRLASLPVLALVLTALPAAAASKHKPHPVQVTSRTTKHARATQSHAKVHAKTVSARPIGMDTERATQIQTALIREGYLTGEPSGTWDNESANAMQKMQSDNGWQTKIVPDSRALIKLGLGPQQVMSN